MAYIDRDKLLNELPNDLPYKASVKRVLIQAEEADVEEVVRCKDCMHNHENGGDCDRVLIHTRRNLVLEKNEYLYYKLNHCEYGERIHNG